MITLKTYYKLKLLLVFGLVAAVFQGCDKDPAVSEIDYATLEDVTLTLKVNGSSSFDLTEKEGVFTYRTDISFDSKEIDWPAPVLELKLDGAVDAGGMTTSVTDASGVKVEAADITAGNSTVRVAFKKADGSYDYLKSATFSISSTGKLKAGFTYDDLIELQPDGFTAQAVFRVDDSGDSIESETATVYPLFEGDPREYPYKLNVVYFVPSDAEPNADYQQRISTILLRHQMFVCKWMKFWGYESKSFGLPMQDNGMVDITYIDGKKTTDEYPYSNGGTILQAEIKQYFKDNGLTFFSDHCLVMIAVNADIASGDPGPKVPYYGWGTWCFASDYPGMDYNELGKDTDASLRATEKIGGMLHELGHAMNQPHVGPTYSQKHSTSYGMTMMGSNQQTYGRRPTFMHETSAAIFNNCQVSSLTKKDFYTETTASLKVTSIKSEGGQCTVKGNFESNRTVTEVFVNLHNPDEPLFGSSGGYSSLAFVTKPVGNTFEITFPIKELRVNTYDYQLGFCLVMDNGTRKTTSLENVYKWKVVGGQYTLETTDIIDKSNWSVETSHPAAEGTLKDDLIDGDLSTYTALVKPGFTSGSISVPLDEQVYVTVNMGERREFNSVRLTYRENVTEYLKPRKISLYGSNDGNIFDPIKENCALNISGAYGTVDLDTAANYRYLKVTFDEWDTSYYSTMHIAELTLF